MKRILIIVLLAGASWAQDIPRKAVKTEVALDAPRFQLIQAKVQLANAAGSKTAFDDLFLLDTKTGKVWRWAENYEQKDAGGTMIVPQHFDPVFVDGLEGQFSSKIVYIPVQTQSPTAAVK